MTLAVTLGDALTIGAVLMGGGILVGQLRALSTQFKVLAARFNAHETRQADIQVDVARLEGRFEEHYGARGR
jgi:hypothetical protein